MNEIVLAGLASLLDGAPNCLAGASRERARSMIRIARKLDGEIAALPSAIPRNSFLAGCHSITAGEPFEHLLVGFGERAGSTTWVEHVYHGVGTPHSVAVPEYLLRAAHTHLLGGFGSEVLFYHNHPRNILNVLFDNEPIASRADRALMLREWLQPAMAIKAVAGGGRARFYLGENDFVREFRVPNLDWLAAMLVASSKMPDKMAAA